MFDIFKNLTKAALGAAFSPVSIAADMVTLGGVLSDRDEPYTVSSMRAVMRNIELAVNPDDLTDEQIEAIIRAVEKRSK